LLVCTTHLEFCERKIVSKVRQVSQAVNLLPNPFNLLALQHECLLVADNTSHLYFLQTQTTKTAHTAIWNYAKNLRSQEAVPLKVDSQSERSKLATLCF